MERSAQPEAEETRLSDPLLQLIVMFKFSFYRCSRTDEYFSIEMKISWKNISNEIEDDGDYPNNDNY